MGKEISVKWLGGEFYFYFHSRDYVLTPMEKHLSFLAGRPNLNFLEIGSCEGQSALWFIKTILTHPTSKITCIDPHDENPNNWYHSSKNSHRLRTTKTTYELFRSNILDKYEEKVTYHRSRSWEVLPTIKSKFDLIYVDGAHDFSNIYIDGKFSMSLLKEDGIIMFDDHWEIEECETFQAINALRKDKIITNEKILNSKAVLILSKR